MGVESVKLHPLWDPHSQYSAFRARYRPAAKMRGYLGHLAALLRRKGMGMVGESPLPGVLRVVVRAEEPTRALAYLVEAYVFPRPQGVEIKLKVHPKDLSRGDGLAADCRAFFLDRATSQSLLTALGGEKTLHDAFTSETLQANPLVAGILSAVPEMDGRMNPDGAILFPSLELSGIEKGVHFLSDMDVVIVVGPGSEGG